MKLTLAALLLVVCATLASGAWPPDKPNHRNKHPHKVVCYWGTWSFYRSGADGKFEPEEINPNLCTHIMYGFAKLVGNKISLYDPDLDTGDENWSSGLTWGHGMIRRVNELRKYNKNLAVMISLGGWNEGSNKYSAMASSAGGRHEFVQSVLAFLAQYEFDGLDIDWEYPAMAATGDGDRTKGRDADKHDYVELLKELHEAFAPHGYILSAAVSAGAPTIDRAYDVPQVTKYLDFINLMTYDFHGGWDAKTAHNAPLHALPGATGIDKEFTVDYAVEYWLKKGADKNKLILGIPLYGRTFTLADPSKTGIGAPATGKGGEAGTITKLVGMLGYNEICAMVKQGGWQVHYSNEQHVPYATHANQWVGYDNEKSVQEKVSYATSKGLGGGMIWTLDTDDFSGHCGKGKFPLLKVISKGFNHVDGPEVTIPRTHATPKPGTDPNHPSNPVTQKPSDPSHPTSHPTGGSFKCTAAGWFADPKTTHKFHQCVDMGNGKLKDFPFDCPAGTSYDANNHVCK